MKGTLVGQRIIKFSDLSSKNIENDEDLVRVVITQHPDLEGGPVEIEALADELKDVEEVALDLVTFELHFPGEEPENVVMEVEAFNKLCTDGNMSDVLKGAKRVTRGSIPSQSGAAAKEKVNYASLDFCGQPHKGRTTEEEARLVRENLEAVNKRLAEQGHRTIDPADPKMRERYGLEEPEPAEVKASK